ncbi:MAG TPA: hypothetical protein VGE40_03315 [Bacilli bacterium]
MIQFIVFLHVLGAIGTGFYLLLPFLFLRLGALSSSAQDGLVSGLFTANRIGQYLLVVQFLTGGYLISQGEYSVAWMVVVIVLFVGAAALAGIMSKPMKALMANAKAGKASAAEAAKIKNFSFIIAILLVVIIVLMNYPAII